MSHPENDREGLSPSPSNILDIFTGDEDEDDDMESYQPTEEQSTGASGFGEEEDSDVDFADAQETLNGIEIVLEAGEDDDEYEDEEGEQTETENGAGRAEGRPTQGLLTTADIRGLLQASAPLRQLILSRYRFIGPGGRDLFAEDEDEDDDLTDDYERYGGLHGRRRRRRPKPAGDRFPKVPSDNGRALMNSGLYGTREDDVDIRRKRRRTVSERLMWRRLGLDARSSMRRQNRLIAQDSVPATTMADKIIHYDSRAYSGQFSDDGNFFFSCTQNFKVRMYDTSNPYEWKYYKTVDYPFGQWTITDATLSPDNRYLAYSSIRHTVCLAPTDPTDHSEHTLLDFTNFAPGSGMGRPTYGYMGRHGFGIWSLRFSGDGREIVAGTSDHSVVVYDIERRQSTVRLSNHEDDVNAVCFGDKMSPHILYSGSDDQTLRVWDRRSMADGRPAGIFVGHTEGLTYVDSKGDGRYVLSNGKDQMMKLWDLRKMISPNDFARIDMHAYTTNFDYRFSPYDEDDYVPNPKDCSVVTFRGHSVLKTLIRCHFSPPGSSNSRYVYSGSEDGKVYIWNMDGTRKETIDVFEATKFSRPRTDGSDGYGYELHGHHNSVWKTCVRDASWSPTAPVMAATSWNGWGMATGTVSLHSWNDGAEDDEALPAMSSNYNARLDMREDFNLAQRRSRAAAETKSRSRAEGRGLRSSVVRPQRLGVDEDADASSGTW
ncbi:1-alkyl-2-acetylglycerophosphocholine esterase [Exophiala viscosa]|uniref:1-alkyl-2-acetylglycerophosphocholine esterase n=1 Tax=Exophiala viscosa TaxID=2486360 RepID=UPI0021992D37|nr:1-alkyl-2-acetylglycerophosphocholine esterase [Exophiala viscosa]